MAVAGVAVAALTVTACGGSGSTSTSTSNAAGGASSSTAPAGSGAAGSGVATSGGVTAEQGVDDGTRLTLWTRAPLEKQARLLVDAYNAGHDNQVELTITPNDDYVAKVGAAAGSDQLPDLFAADIVYVPNWTSQRLFADVTDKINALPYRDTINSGHLEAGTYDGKEFVLPFVLDLSVLMYNKDLYTEAGSTRRSHPPRWPSSRIRPRRSKR